MIHPPQQINGFIIAGGASLSVLHMIIFMPFEGSRNFEFILIILASISFALAILSYIKNLKVK